MLRKALIATAALAGLGIGAYFSRHALGKAVDAIGAADPNWLSLAALASPARPSPRPAPGAARSGSPEEEDHDAGHFLDAFKAHPRRSAGNVGLTSGAIAVALKAHHVAFHDGLAAGLAFHAVETGVGLLFGIGAAVWFAPAIKARTRLTSAV